MHRLKDMIAIRTRKQNVILGKKIHSHNSLRSCNNVRRPNGKLMNKMRKKRYFVRNSPNLHPPIYPP